MNKQKNVNGGPDCAARNKNKRKGADEIICKKPARRRA